VFGLEAQNGLCRYFCPLLSASEPVNPMCALLKRLGGAPAWAAHGDFHPFAQLR